MFSVGVADIVEEVEVEEEDGFAEEVEEEVVDLIVVVDEVFVEELDFAVEVDVTRILVVLVVVLHVGWIFLEVQAAELEYVIVEVLVPDLDVDVHEQEVIVVDLVDVMTAGTADTKRNNSNVDRTYTETCILTARAQVDLVPGPMPDTRHRDR